MAATSMIDNPGKYPIVLSDALLGKSSMDVYTGIRYNHKPESSSESSSNPMHLQQSNSNPSSYNLSLTDNSEKYSYNGTRTSNDGQYVLIFDEANKRFVLHKVDSTFDMNLVRAPWESDASTLRSQYPQLEPPTKTDPQPSQKKQSKPLRNPLKPEPKRKKVAEKPKKAKPPPRQPTPEEDESDDGFTIEYPDGPQSSQPCKSQSTPVFHRDASEEVSDEDAEGEEYEDERNQDVDHLKLPSPANNASGMSDEELELDLEAELEEALRETAGTGAGESDESEED